ACSKPSSMPPIPANNPTLPRKLAADKRLVTRPSPTAVLARRSVVDWVIGRSITDTFGSLSGRSCLAPEAGGPSRSDLPDILGSLPTALAPAVVNVWSELAPGWLAYPAPFKPASTERPTKSATSSQHILLVAWRAFLLGSMRCESNVDLSQV